MEEKVIICDKSSSENMKSCAESITNVIKNGEKCCFVDITFNDVMSKLPEFLRPKDLIKLGLFRSASDICWAMKRNQSPPFIRLSAKKVIFSRTRLCEWLKQKSSSDNLNNEVENARS